MPEFLIIIICVAAAALLVFVVDLLLIKPASRKHEVLERNGKYLYSHRGFFDRAAGVPENSLKAFGRAVENNYGFEFDVRLTKDKKLMVMHDDHIERMTGIDKLISETDSAELREYRLLGTEEKIPYLAEVLELVAGKIPLIVELKVANANYAELCAAVCDMLDSYSGDYMLESFDPRVVFWLKKNRPELCRGQLLCCFHKHGDKEPGVLIDFLLHNQLTSFVTKPDFIAMDVVDRTIPPMRLSKKLYKVCEVNWTIRSQEELDVCLNDGAVPIFEGFTPTQKSPLE